MAKKQDIKDLIIATLRHTLERRTNEMRWLEDSFNRFKKEISSRFEIKMSGQYVCFDEKDGKFIDPIIVCADGIEEALAPENESYQKTFAIPISDKTEFKDI